MYFINTNRYLVIQIENISVFIFCRSRYIKNVSMRKLTLNTLTHAFTLTTLVYCSHYFYYIGNWINS